MVTAWVLVSWFTERFKLLSLGAMLGTAEINYPQKRKKLATLYVIAVLFFVCTKTFAKVFQFV